MAIENRRVFQKADIDKYGYISFHFHNEEWTDGKLTDSLNHNGSCHISECGESGYEQIQAFALMANKFPNPGEEPVQSSVDLLVGQVAESERILSEKRLELLNLTGEIEVDGVAITK